MRKALIVGIDWYANIDRLSGCVNDARSVHGALEYHANKEANFLAPKLMTATGPETSIGRGELKDEVRKLFTDEAAVIALFYFAGHGYLEDTGGFLCTSECATGDEGLSLAEVMTLAGRSPAKNKIIILDSCHSGIAGSRADLQSVSEIVDGMTILTASAANQYAFETPGGGSGVFTNLLIDALYGGAANLAGDVTPGSIYAHIDQSLGPWAGQRPMFKTCVRSFISLRKAEPQIPIQDLRALSHHFPDPDHSFPLDPGHEPERSAEQLADPEFPKPDPDKTTIFAVLQRYVAVNLVRPVGASSMWHAAMGRKACELTPLGRHYRNLAANKLI